MLPCIDVRYWSDDAGLQTVEPRQSAASPCPKLTPMKNHARWLFVLLFSASSLAMAQWQWLDKDGRMVFSDRAPPVNVPAKAIVKRPGTPQVVAASSGTKEVAAAPLLAASAPQGAGVDKDLLKKKKMAEAEQAAKAKVEEQRRQATQADNCQRAKSAKAGFDSGVRMSRTNAQGEREVMDDAARAAETKRIQSVIDSDCK